MTNWDVFWTQCSGFCVIVIFYVFNTCLDFAFHFTVLLRLLLFDMICVLGCVADWTYNTRKL